MPKRVVACRLALDLIRIGARAFFGEVLASTKAVDVLLLCAVCVGSVQGRPMNAGKLAYFAELPRPTVVRRLAAMQRARIVSRLPSGCYELGPALAPETSDAATQECTKAIRRAATELSKLDG